MATYIFELVDHLGEHGHLSLAVLRGDAGVGTSVVPGAGVQSRLQDGCAGTVVVVGVIIDSLQNTEQ